jgi:hypothetical protein
MRAGGRHAVAGRGLPEPCTVEVRRGTVLPRPRDLRLEVLPRRLLPAEVALGQLDQQRGGRLGDGSEVVGAEQAVRLADGAADQPLEALERAPLVLLEVAHRVVEHRAPPPPLGVHPQDDLLGHHPAREEHGGLGAEHVRDHGLELGDHATVAVPVDDGLRRDRRERIGGEGRTVAGEVSGAGGAELVRFGFGQHPSSLPRVGRVDTDLGGRG